MFSHSGARAIGDHARNVPDNVLENVKENGGVVMVVLYRYLLRLIYKEIRTLITIIRIFLPKMIF